MLEPKQDPTDGLIDVPLDLDENQLAQIDALIEEHSTPSHRLTREEMLQILVEKGSELVEQGASLLPFLKGAAAEDVEEAAPSSVPASGDPAKH
jgi:hypothetical protein